MLVGFTLGFGLAVALGALACWGLHARFSATRAAALNRVGRAERLAAATEPVIVLSPEGHIQDLNAGAATLLTAADGAAGAPLTALVHPDDRRRLEALVDPAGAAGSQTEVVRLRGASGSWQPWEAVPVPLSAASGELASRVNEVVLRLRDVGEREALREELAAQRLYDPATGLPTRKLYFDRLAHALALAARRAELLGVFLLDPRVLSTAAPEPGGDDRLAVAIAQRVQLALRHGDTLARLDDGRYAVLLEALHDVFDAARVAERLLERFIAPLSEDGVQVLLSPHVGIALGGGHERPDDLLLQAEAALCAVRGDAISPYAVYDPTMSVMAVDEAGLDRELRRGLMNGEARLLFQPIVRLDDARVIAYEAGPVWHHPRRGFVATPELFAIAEAVGMSLPLQQWTLAAVCGHLREWQQTRSGGAPTVCLDVPPQWFRHPMMAGDLARVLYEVGVSPHQLRLEIDQVQALEDGGATVRRLQALQEIGVQVAIDGFGTGYAALGFLQRCPVDCLKIGPSYVAGLGVNPDDTAIVRAALAFARGLDISVIADGIETTAQRDELRRLGCAFGQGHFFGPPLPPDQLAASDEDTLQTISGQPADAGLRAPSGSAEATGDDALTPRGL